LCQGVLISRQKPMNADPDPFVHHPELRDEIADPMQSFMRSFTTATLAAKMKELGQPVRWWYLDGQREAMRARTLDGHRENDLWIFGYGSLMWDPGFRFAEVRRARVPDHARRFILKDIYGARGTADAPGLMAALDEGPGCDGLLFRIARELVEEETEVLWRREQIGPAYTATFVEAISAGRPIKALTFVADRDADLIDPNLTREEQVHTFWPPARGFWGRASIT